MKNKEITTHTVQYGTGRYQNIYESAEIGEGTTIGAFVEIGKNVKIGKNCKIQAFVFIPEGVTVGDNVFIGPHVCFTNCTYPEVDRKELFKAERTVVEDNVVIGAGSIILPRCDIGKGAFIGAGTLVSRCIPSDAMIIQTRNTDMRRIDGNS